jgi:serpin B
MKSPGCALVLTLCAMGCANGTETDNPATPEGIELVRSDVAYLTTSDVPDSDLEAIQKAQRMFALDLYREVADNAEPGDNLLVSPYSVATILAMTYAGARGNTQQQMAAVLHLGEAAGALDPAMNAVANSLRQESEQSGLELRLFNALWLSNTLEPEQPFLDTLSKYYDSGVYHVDFASGPEAARKRINSWVTELTGGTIEDLLPQGAIHADTALVLSNAVFLSAKWRDPFEPAHTQDGAFTLESGAQETVPMMSREWEYPAVFRSQWRAVELAYQNSQVSMVFVLPNEGELVEFDAAFDEARLDEIVQALDDAKLSSDTLVSLRLPRFGFDASVDLVPRLGALGMTDAFSDAAANFSGIASDPLYIETALHKSHIAVDEVGTVATAATIQVGVPAAIAPSLFFDRPFVFFIYDHANGTVLFVGRLSDPGGERIAGDPTVFPSDPERICSLLVDCPGRTISVEACQASFDGDDASVVDQCADCLQLRKDMCFMDDYCTDGGVSVCNESACADECPAHEF